MNEHKPAGELEALLTNEISRALADKPVATPRDNQRNPSPSMVNFLTEGRKMLEDQQNMMASEETRWREQRVKVQNEYVLRAKALMREAEDALHTLDVKYETKLSEDNRVLAALRAVVAC